MNKLIKSFLIPLLVLSCMGWMGKVFAEEEELESIEDVYYKRDRERLEAYFAKEKEKEELERQNLERELNDFDDFQSYYGE